MSEILTVLDLRNCLEGLPDDMKVKAYIDMQTYRIDVRSWRHVLDLRSCLDGLPGEIKVKAYLDMQPYRVDAYVEEDELLVEMLP
jgi:hypothetical protein